MKLYSVLLFAALCASCAEDDGGQTPGDSFREPVPETITLDDAVVTYYGDDSYSGVSDLWTLDLAQSSAGQRLVLSLNVTPNPAGVPDPGLLAGTYRMPANSGDMSAGTYNPGYMTEQDRPNGAVMVPAGTYLAGVAAETSDADLLREGACTVEVDADGRMRIEGTLVGTSYLKRYFTYEGTPQLVDGSGTSGSGVPNSNLNADVRLESLSATRIVDKGDSYFLGDESYRHFVFFLADAGIDLSTQWPGGDGELLRIELFVPWDTDPADGIPAGIYTVPDDVPPSGGVYREDIVPHRLRKKTEIRKSKTISSKSVTLGIFFCYTTTDEYPVGSRKLDKSSNQIVTKKKNGNFGYDFVDMSLICRCLRSILSTRRNLKS